MLALANKLTNSTQPIYRFVNKYSIDFDGVDDLIVTDGADTVLQPTTYAFWCKSSETDNNTVFGHGADREGGFHFKLFGDNRPILFLGASSYIYWNNTTAQDDGKWHQWVLYSDTNNITNSKLYLDGVLQTIAASNVSSLQAYTQSLTIGSDKQGGGEYFKGQIDEFAVFDRELKQDEITRMYNTYYTPNRVANGNFAQIGNEEVSNGDFSQIGSELVVNGDFATDTDWIKGTNWTISGGTASNSGSANFSDLTQNNTDITIGKNYKITYTVSDYVSGSFKFIMNNNTASGLERNADGTYTDYISALSQGYSFRTQGSGFVGSIDNVTIKEVGQDWVFGTSWSMGDGKAIFTTGSASLLSQDMGVVAGKSYEVYLELTGSGGNFYLGTNTSAVSMPVGTYTLYLTAASGANSSIGFLNNGGAASGTLDNVSVKEVGQNWTLGAGTTIENGVANITVASSGSSALSQAGGAFVTGKSFKVSFTISNYSSGSIAVSNLSPTTFRNANGTYTLDAVGAGGDFLFFSSGFVGSVDNIVVQELKSDATNLMLNAGAYQSANPLITSTKSMEFDGADDYLIANITIGSFVGSISCWIKRDDNTGEQFIADFRGLGGTGAGYIYFPNSDVLSISSGTPYVDGVQTATVKTDGFWHNVVIKGITLNLTENILFGMQFPVALFIDGKMTEFGLWDRVLTDLEIASLYNQGMPTNLLVNRNDYQSGNPTVFNTKQVDFDGSDDYLIANSTLGSFTGSLSFWFKRDTSAAMYIYDTRGIGNTGVGYLFIEANGNIGTANGTTYVDGVAATTVPLDNNWHHLVVSGSNLNITTDIIFGSRYSIGAILNGQMSQAGLFNSTLTANEVSSLYNHGLPIDLNTNQAAYTSSSNLVGYWRMGSGTLDSFPLIADQTNATLGSELVINGTFLTNTTTGWNDWLNITNPSNTSQQDGYGILDATTGICDARQEPTVTAGKTYKIEATLKEDAGGNGKFYMSDGGNYSYAFGNFNATTTETTFVKYVVPTQTVIRLYAYNAGTAKAYFKNISVKEVGGSPAIMTNQTASDIENGSPYANFIIDSSNLQAGAKWNANSNWNDTVAGKFTCTAGATSDINQGYDLPVIGKSYVVSFEVLSISAGSFRFTFGGVTGINRDSVGVYTETITATSTDRMRIRPVDTLAAGSVTNITATEVNTGLQGYWKMGDGTNDEYPVIYDQTNPTNGAELVTNGDVESALPTFNGVSFTNYQSANTLSSLQSHLGSNSMKVTGTATLFNTRIIPNNSSYLNKTFKVSLWVYNPSTLTGDIAIRTRINAVAKLIGTLSVKNTWTNYTYYMTSTNTASDRFIEVESLTGINTQFFFIDDISVKEVQGNPATMTNMVEGNITNQYPLTKIRNYYRMGDGILDKFPCIQDQTSPNLAHIPTTNLLLYSEDFSQSYWNKQSNITPTYNTTETTSPIGTNNVTKLVGNGSDGVFKAGVSVTGVVARSVYLKSVTGDINVKLKDPNATITTLTLDVTTEWKRFELSEDNGTSLQGLWVDDIPASGIYIWGAQLEEQSQATAYIKSDGIAAVRKATTTNLVTYSEDFSQSIWNKINASVTGGFTSPDGTNSAYKLIEDTSTGLHNLRMAGFSQLATDNITVSVYGKKGERNFICLYEDYSDDGRVFDLENGTITNYRGSAISSSMELLSNGYYRLKMTVFPNATISQFKIFVTNNSTNASYTGDGTSGVYIFGAQLEVQTQAETYAKTTGLPVTIDLFTENNYGTMTNMVAGDIVLDTPNNPA